MKSVGTKPTRAFNDDVVHEVHVRGLTMNDTNDVVPNTDAGDNDRGYSTPDRFAPDRRHSSDKTAGGPTREFKAMVKAYHDAGTAMNRIVAEPWAIGSGTYRLGNFPSGWSEWNGGYRDLVREA